MNRSFTQICQEPFRIFFPTGILLGLLGVSLWLLFYFGLVVTYPNIAHARLMIEGLMASFIFALLRRPISRPRKSQHSLRSTFSPRVRTPVALIDSATFVS
jgi:hypothetical protein